MAAPELAIVGRIRKPHGLRGELLIDLATDDPEHVFVRGRRLLADPPADAASAPGARAALTVRSARAFKEGLLVHFEEIADRTEAERWREHELLAPLGDLRPLAEAEVYYHELEGMTVETSDGSAVGVVSTFYELPQGLMLEVDRGDGREALVPFRGEIVRTVDRGARRIVIEPPEGLLEG